MFSPRTNKKILTVKVLQLRSLLHAGRSVTRAVVTEGRACNNTIAAYVSVPTPLLSNVLWIETDETVVSLTVSGKVALQWFVLF
jgi:hypothetical protein